jgi:hypothetical protein
MANLKDLSAQITQALDKILPEEVRCAFVLIDIQEKEVSTVSNMSDDSTIALLEEAVRGLENPEIVTDTVDNAKSN